MAIHFTPGPPMTNEEYKRQFGKSPDINSLTVNMSQEQVEKFKQGLKKVEMYDDLEDEGCDQSQD